MSKCIILEGPDCTGKSTLAKKLSQIYSIPIYHLTYYENKEKHLNQFLDASNKIKSYLKDFHGRVKNGGLILDRYIFSEYVYNKVYRENTPLIQGYYEMSDDLKHYLKNNFIEIIFTLPKDKERWLNFYKEQETKRCEMYTSEKMDKVYDIYLSLYNNLNYSSITRYDLFDNF